MEKPVLIVETDALCLSALSFLVLSAGHRPMAFTSGREVCPMLDRLDAEPAAMITEFDLNTPCEARCILDTVRRRYPGLPIIVLTADTSAAAREALEGLDCHVLFKPSRPEEILDLLPSAHAPKRGVSA